MHEDFDRCYRAVQSKDARFDGWFVTAVLTTRIYCRPSCPVRPPFARTCGSIPPRRRRASRVPSLQAVPAGRLTGSPEWNVRGDVVARAMRLIADGTIDREGVTGLASRVGYTTRQLERMLQAEVGANPLALARAQRTQTARVLIETTDLPFGDVAFAAGFSSIRQFNDTIRTVCDLTLTALRRRAEPSSVSAKLPPRAVVARLPVRTPFAYEACRPPCRVRVPGVEECAKERTDDAAVARWQWNRQLTPEPDHAVQARAGRPRELATRSPAVAACWTWMPTPRPLWTCLAPTRI